MMTDGGKREINAIIKTLSVKEGRRFTALCRRVTLNQGDVLWEPGQDLQLAYFPTSGIISQAITLDNQSQIGLDLIGRDGMVGAPLSLGILTTTMRTVVQIAGSALIMPASQLQQELRANSHLLESVQHCHFRLMMQIQQNAACLHFHEVESRLARWLLAIQDLSLTDTFHLTHGEISDTLGVRRSSITLGVCSLHRRGLISHSRGEIRILDHAGLENAACDCHAALIKKYRKVFGKETRRRGPESRANSTTLVRQPSGNVQPARRPT